MVTCNVTRNLRCSMGISKSELEKKFGTGTEDELLKKLQSYAVSKFSGNCETYRQYIENKTPGYGGDMKALIMILGSSRGDFEVWCPYAALLPNTD